MALKWDSDDTTCDNCDEEFITAEQLKNHSCKKIFLNSTSYSAVEITPKQEVDEIIIKQEEEPVTFPCWQCDKIFAQQRFLNNHIKRHQAAALDSQFICTECPKQFKTQVQLNKHARRNHHTSDPMVQDFFLCTKCSKPFKTREGVRDHEYSIHGEKTIQCGQCQRWFVRKCDFRKHSCNFKCEYHCNQCDHIEVTKKKLDKHMMDAHQTHYKSFSCDICPKSFFQSGALKNHKRSHTGETPYQCSECGKKFKTKANLIGHMVVHDANGATMYSCDKCPKMFSRTTTLRRHMETHGEKRFICAFCQKGFFQLSNLQSHEKLHTGEHPYKCTVCHKTFIQLSNLKSHKQKLNHWTNDPNELKKVTQIDKNNDLNKCEKNIDVKRKENGNGVGSAKVRADSTCNMVKNGTKNNLESKVYITEYEKYLQNGNEELEDNKITDNSIYNKITSKSKMVKGYIGSRSYLKIDCSIDDANDLKSSEIKTKSSKGIERNEKYANELLKLEENTPQLEKTKVGHTDNISSCSTEGQKNILCEGIPVDFYHPSLSIKTEEKPVNIKVEPYDNLVIN